MEIVKDMNNDKKKRQSKRIRLTKEIDNLMSQQDVSEDNILLKTIIGKNDMYHYQNSYTRIYKMYQRMKSIKANIDGGLMPFVLSRSNTLNINNNRPSNMLIDYGINYNIQKYDKIRKLLIKKRQLYEHEIYNDFIRKVNKKEIVQIIERLVWYICNNYTQGEYCGFYLKKTDTSLTFRLSKYGNYTDIFISRCISEILDILKESSGNEEKDNNKSIPNFSFNRKGYYFKYRNSGFLEISTNNKMEDILKREMMKIYKENQNQNFPNHFSSELISLIHEYY